MKNFIFLFLLVPLLLFAQVKVDTKDGVPITASTDMDGVTFKLSQADGQLIVGGVLDTIPDQFTYVDVDSVALNSWNHGFIVCAGCDSARFYTSITDTFRIGFYGTFTIGPIWVVAGDSLYTSLVAAPSNATPTHSTIYAADSTIIDTFTVTTIPSGGIDTLASAYAETGDVLEFTLYDTTGGGILSAETFAAKNGTYGYQSIFDSSIGVVYSFGRLNFDAVGAAFTSYWYYIDPDLTMKINESWDVLNMGSTRLFLESDGSGIPYRWVMKYDGGGYSFNTTDFSLGAWMFLEIYSKKGGGSNSEHKVWVDGVNILDKTDGSATTDMSESLFGVSSFPEDVSGYVWFDDCVVTLQKLSP